MIEGARYAHTKLIARDWRKLAAFYIKQFGCSVVPPERNFSARDLEAGTRIPGAALSGVHLRLPGRGVEGPTLEMFTYSELADSLTPRVNRPGYGHLAFQVNSVADARQQVLSAGGDSVGDIVTLTTAAGTNLRKRSPKGSRAGAAIVFSTTALGAYLNKTVTRHLEGRLREAHRNARFALCPPCCRLTAAFRFALRASAAFCF